MTPATTTEEQVPRQEIWRDERAPVTQRVADLVGRMTTREKVGQLYGLWLTAAGTNGEVAPYQDDMGTIGKRWEDLAVNGVGQLTRPYGTVPVEPRAGAEALARIQGQIVQAGRFGIPALVHEECLTGVAAWQAPVYPSPLCWGATFDPELIERLGAAIGGLMVRLGIHQGLAPVLDVVRDLRWGRTEETIGEDPYLVGTIGSAYVKGVQSTGVVATLKHFVGYSASRSARNLAPVSMGPRELGDVFLPPFEMALREGARSVMNSYADIDGVPTVADPSLLSDLLRGTYGFTGTVVSDYFAIAFLAKLHGVALDRTEAAVLALSAGVDVELPMVDCFGDPLVEALVAGAVDEALIDRAVARVLAQKCELGLLDAGWSPEPPVMREQRADLDDPATRALAREMAERSIVLLHNDGSLPLAAGARLALVGPRADVAGAMLGDYSFPMHIGRRFPDLPLGIPVPTVRDALAADPAGYEVFFCEGCPVVDENNGSEDNGGIALAAELARSADVCIAVLGDNSGLFGAGTSGEGCDALDLHLPGRQEQLLAELVSTGVPVVVVLLVGRPYDLSAFSERLAAVLCGFFPGEEGAGAIADVLSGRANPSGRLPVSFPGRGGGQPGTYLGPRLAHANRVTVVDPAPLFPFGHGLSYYPASWVRVHAASADDWPTDGVWEVAVSLHNGHHRATSEVVQVYLQDPVAEVARPERQLIAMKRVNLGPGATCRITFTLHADLTSYTGRSGRRHVDPGEVRLLLGPSSTDIKASLTTRLSGPRREVGYDRVLHPVISITPFSAVR